MITINLSLPATKSLQCPQVPAVSSLQNNNCFYCDAVPLLSCRNAGCDPQVSLGELRNAICKQTVHRFPTYFLTKEFKFDYRERGFKMKTESKEFLSKTTLLAWIQAFVKKQTKKTHN